MKNFKFLIAGIAFGFLAVKSEITSWFRIQEMFHFQSFHMYGIISSAIAVGMLSYLLIKKYKIISINGEQMDVPPKKFTKGVVLGGLIFGMGWALTGACPGPLYAIFGSGVTVMFVAIVSAILGTYVYGVLKDKLPH